MIDIKQKWRESEVKGAVLQAVAILSLTLLVIMSLETLSRNIGLESALRNILTEDRILRAYNFVMNLTDYIAALITATLLAVISFLSYRSIYSTESKEKENEKK